YGIAARAEAIRDGNRETRPLDELMSEMGVSREALDGLAAAEHRATRAEAQSDIRGRAVAVYRERAREAEARIQAVQDLIPSCREDARTEFYEMLANIWDEAYNAGFKDSKIWDETGATPNPYIQEAR